MIKYSSRKVHSILGILVLSLPAFKQSWLTASVAWLGVIPTGGVFDHDLLDEIIKNLLTAFKVKAKSGLDGVKDVNQLLISLLALSFKAFSHLIGDFFQLLFHRPGGLNGGKVKEQVKLLCQLSQAHQSLSLIRLAFLFLQVYFQC